MGGRFVPTEEMEAMRRDFEKLMNAIGNRSTCRLCGKKIWWVKTKHGKRLPVSENMVAHFADCRNYHS